MIRQQLLGYHIHDDYFTDSDTDLLHSKTVYYNVHVTSLGVLCCFALFVCLTLLASFFLPSHLSFKNMYYKYYMGSAFDASTLAIKLSRNIIS